MHGGWNPAHRALVLAECVWLEAMTCLLLCASAGIHDVHGFMSRVYRAGVLVLLTKYNTFVA